MDGTWKSLLYQYVEQHNRMEADYSIDPLLPFLTDDRYIAMQNRRLARIKEAHMARRFRPATWETRCKLKHVSGGASQVEVYLELTKAFVYDAYTEYRVETEKIRIAENGAKWRIVSVSADMSERRQLHMPERPNGAIERQNDREEGGKQKSVSVPYLNQSVFAGGRMKSYDRQKAKWYADRWWNGRNPDFADMEVDCSNFISQCLFAGGAPMNYTGTRDTGWWYKGRVGGRELWSYSWSVAHQLQRYLSVSRSGLRAQIVHSPYDLDIGDLIAYDWDGDSRFQHSVIVTSFAPDGAPLVNAHTVNSFHRYWDYRDSYAWTERTMYKFFRISDVF
ncbi:MAG TPA: amidase domain-containing protein [Bacilli bacterium]